MKYLTFLIILLPTILIGQSKNGYYMNWNRDHTGQTIKPMIPISKAEAGKINCYWVEFDERNRFKNVKYFNSGKPSSYSNYGAHELVRIYSDSGGYHDEFKDISGESTVNTSEIKYYKYKLDDEGYWIEIRNLDKKGDLVEENGVSVIKVKRDYQNRILTEIHLNLKRDTVPDPNGFKVVHFTYDHNNYMTSRQNKDEAGKLVNSKEGYAKVVFQFDHNGMFYGEEFLKEDGKLVNHPRLGYAKIDFRDFNKYGKSFRQYYTDENGYPSANITMGKLIYNSNTSRKELTYFNRIGEEAENSKGIAKILYAYDSTGKFLGRKYLSIKGEIIQ